MAAVSAEDIGAALRAARKRDLHRYLDADPRVREWLATAVLGTREASDYVGVGRVELWRWVKAERLTPVVKLKSTPLFLKADLDRIKRERASDGKA